MVRLKQKLSTVSMPSYIRSDTDLLYGKNAGIANQDAQQALIYSDPSIPMADDETALFDDARSFGPSAAPSMQPSVTSLNEPHSSNKDHRLRSEMEINAQHYQKQQEYRKHRKQKRTLTDIDFEGILNIIGGCNLWQITVYMMISAQQVPHAMFNLSVVYMMYQPDHWCKVHDYSESHFRKYEQNYTWSTVLNSTVAFPQVFNLQRKQVWHDQCHYYDRDYAKISKLSWDKIANMTTDVPQKRCVEWEYDTSVMERTVVTEWNRVCDDNWSRAHVHLSYSLGYLIGCLLGGFVSDRYGRKTAIYGFGILSAIFGFLLPFSKEFEIFLVVRFLLAACNEGADLAAYVLCMEITGVRYRSIVGSLLQAPWACGYALLALVACLTKSWTAIHMITVTLHGISLIFIHFLPESPRWLILINRVDEAEIIIRKACHYNKSSLPSDLELVRHAEQRKWMKQNEKPSFIHLFRSKELRARMSILLVVWIATALVYYGLVIALSDQSSPGRSVFDGNFFLNNAIAGAIELPTLVMCVFLLRYGRKRSQMITLFGAAALIMVAMVATTQRRTTLALLFMLLGKACIQGSFNILYIFTSELNPTIVRNSAVGISSMIARMGSGASGYIAILSDVTLPIVPMLIFAVFAGFAGILVFFLPETQGLPLPDTIWDAVTMLKTQKTPSCTSFQRSREEEKVEMEEAYKPASRKNTQSSDR
ncbi:unnamed protein product, partial [Mesorhabditis spiculigera]